MTLGRLLFATLSFLVLGILLQAVVSSCINRALLEAAHHD